jgi:molybdopterin biosynthesis enzyme
MLSTLARADALVVRAPHCPARVAGDKIEILRLE